MAGHFQLDINIFNYDLPDERIAKYPLGERDSSKLLVRDALGCISETVFRNIPEYLAEKSLLVYNNTKVIHARLNFRKRTGAKIEIFCLNPCHPIDYQQSLSQTKHCSWECMVGNLKKWKGEVLEMQVILNNVPITIFAKNITKDKTATQTIEFTWDGGCTFAEILEQAGEIPIPPYLNRLSEDIDKERYQTIYSNFNGSVAAPTAGLHFTNDVFKELTQKHIEEAEVTLHVGAGTFQPVKAENARDHQMHSEQIIITKDLLQKLIEHKGKIIATGTTTMRTLESIYWLGVKLIRKKSIDKLEQWDWETLDNSVPMETSLKKLIDYIDRNHLQEISSKTEIMIVPGYEFKVVSSLITNFHQPKSTLLLLIAAFINEDWKDVYRYALNNNFRFLSYGDSSLLHR